MDNQSMMMGMLIKKYRLEQNMSQEALCQGICAVSYLSKIEKGSVNCSQEILHQLMEVLGIDLNRNPEELSEQREGLDQFFRNMFLYNLQEMDRLISQLNESKEMLQHSSLAVDYMLATGFHQHVGALHRESDLEELGSLVYGLLDYERYMSPHQTHLTHYLIGHFEMLHKGDYQKALSQFQRGARIKRDGIILEGLASVHYTLGNYAESIRLGDLAFQQLMEEGYLERAIGVCFVIAAAYANVRDIDNMLVYYRRLLTLSEKTDNSRRGGVHYNIGAAYLAVRKFEQAKNNLEKAYHYYKEEEPSYYDKFYLLQKLALASHGLGEPVQAEGYTGELQKLVRDNSERSIGASMETSLEWLIQLCIKKVPLKSPYSIDILRRLYKQAKKDSHHGFRTFYGDYLIEALKAQHKYKEALQITEEIFAQWKVSSKP